MIPKANIEAVSIISDSVRQSIKKIHCARTEYKRKIAI
jgi:hypothetical protein